MACTLSWNQLSGPVRVLLGDLIAPYWEEIARAIDHPRVHARDVRCSLPPGRSVQDMSHHFIELLRNQGYPFSQFAQHATAVYRDGTLAADLERKLGRPLDDALAKMMSPRKPADLAPGAV